MATCSCWRIYARGSHNLPTAGRHYNGMDMRRWFLAKDLVCRQAGCERTKCLQSLLADLSETLCLSALVAILEPLED